jgi:hypothetical protein
VRQTSGTDFTKLQFVRKLLGWIFVLKLWTNLY